MHYETGMSCHATEHYCMWEWNIYSCWLSQNTRRHVPGVSFPLTEETEIFQHSDHAMKLSGLLPGQSDVATAQKLTEIFLILDRFTHAHHKGCWLYSLPRGTKTLHIIMRYILSYILYINLILLSSVCTEDLVQLHYTLSCWTETEIFSKHICHTYNTLKTQIALMNDDKKGMKLQSLLRLFLLCLSYNPFTPVYCLTKKMRESSRPSSHQIFPDLSSLDSSMIVLQYICWTGYVSMFMSYNGIVGTDKTSIV